MPDSDRLTPTELKWGLLALGRCGQTQVDVDTSCGPERLLALEISTPLWSVRFRIPEPTKVRALASFFQEGSEQSMLAGSFAEMPVEIRRDCQQGTRFFVVIGQGDARTELTIAGEQAVAELAGALSQAAEELK